MFRLSVYSLWHRELVRFWREKARVLGFVASPLLFWVLIGSGFGNLAFFFPGALVLTIMFSAVFSTMSLIEDRREGFLLSMLVSPAPRSAMVLGKVLGSATLAWLQGLVFLCFLPVTGQVPGLVSLLSAAGVIFLISFSFTVLGFALAWRMESAQGFHAIMNLVLFPLWMASGALFPADKAHGWILWVIRANPLTYMLDALRAPLEGRETAVGLAVTAIFAAVFFVLSAAEASQKSVRSVA